MQNKTTKAKEHNSNSFKQMVTFEAHLNSDQMSKSDGKQTKNTCLKTNITDEPPYILLRQARFRVVAWGVETGLTRAQPLLWLLLCFVKPGCLVCVKESVMDQNNNNQASIEIMGRSDRNMNIIAMP